MRASSSRGKKEEDKEKEEKEEEEEEEEEEEKEGEGEEEEEEGGGGGGGGGEEKEGEGPLIKILRTEPRYGSITWFIKHYMKMTRKLPFLAFYIRNTGQLWKHVKGIPFFNIMYTKGVRFLSKGVGPRGGGTSSYKTLQRPPGFKG